jgi:putative Mg2+ transporter-C (MgtC) family protein
MELSEFSLRLGASMLAGLAIGFERQWNQKAAGLRTNTLVALGSAVYVLLSIQWAIGSSGDLTRVLGQVVTGIGFLGAGIIFKEGFAVRGLTTAATVWCSAAVGCLMAAGFFMQGLVATLFILGINALLLPVDNWLSNRTKKSKDV